MTNNEVSNAAAGTAVEFSRDELDKLNEAKLLQQQNEIEEKAANALSEAIKVNTEHTVHKELSGAKKILRVITKQGGDPITKNMDKTSNDFVFTKEYIDEKEKRLRNVKSPEKAA